MLTIHNKTYKTETEVAKELGVSREVFYEYTVRHKDLSLDEIYDIIQKKSEEMTIDGVRYMSITQIANKLGLPLRAFTYIRDRENLSIIETYNYIVENMVVLDGKICTTEKQLATKLGIPYARLIYYLRLHPELDTIKKMYNHLQEIDLAEELNVYKLDGVTYTSKRQVATALGVSKITFYKLLSTSNRTVQEAYDYYKNKNYEYRGVTYTSVRQLALAYGWNYSTFASYLRNHKCTVQEAADYYYNKFAVKV